MPDAVPVDKSESNTNRASRIVGPNGIPDRNPVSKGVLALCVIVAAFNLRIAITSLGPVLRDAIAETGMSTAVASALTMIPPVCFGFFGPMASYFSARIGIERALLLALSLLTTGLLLRAVTNELTLFAGQILACAAIGFVNVLLPSLIKRDFNAHVPAMTGTYTMTFSAGAGLAAATTVPLQHALGSWNSALAFWAAPAAVACLGWLAQIRFAGPVATRARRNVTGLLRDPIAWQLAIFMGALSALAYTIFGWLAPLLRDRGLDAVDAGYVYSIAVASQAVGSLVAPYLATRGKDQRLINAASAIVQLLAIIGCVYGSIASIWFFAAIVGLAQGALISLALTMIVLRSPDPHVAARLSSMVQGIGYLLASTGPLLSGLIRGWTGGWEGVVLFCGALVCVLVPAGMGAGRAKYVNAASTPS